MSKILQTKEKLSLIENATDIAAEGIIITDAQIPGNPIIYANEGFERLTGYPKEYVKNKNCRFLQGKDTDPQSIDEIRQAIREEQEITVELLNYRKDGTPFWNRLSITPLKNKDGTVTHFVGVQSDITELKNTKDELESANRKLQKFHKEMINELEQAKLAQEFILPQDISDTEEIRIATKFVPLSQIGGDFFDIVKVSQSAYGFLIADVTGHGIPAALLTFMSSNTFKDVSQGEYSTEKVIDNTNARLFGNMPVGTFVSMFYAIYDITKRELGYTQAGHPPGLLIRPRNKEVIQLVTEGMLVGIFPQEDVRFGEKKVEFYCGDKLLLFTDAITEAFENNGNILDMEDLKSFVKTNIYLPIDELLEEVYTFGLQFSGQEVYHDDATLIGFEVLK